MQLYHRETITARSIRAESFYNYIKDNSWLILGGREPWLEENNPPVPSDTNISIADAFAAIYIDKVLLVKEDVNGSLSYGSHNYEEVSDSYNNPLIIYIEALIESDKLINLGADDYRTLGIYTNVSLIDEPNKERGEVIEAGNITSKKMIWVSNFSPINITQNESELFKFVKRF